MCMNQMIAQVPSAKPYRKRHLESVEQMIRLNEADAEGDGAVEPMKLAVLLRSRRGSGDHPHPARQPRHRADGLRGGRHVRGLLLHHRFERDARQPHREGRAARPLPIRRLSSLPRLSPRCDRRVQAPGDSTATRPQVAAGTCSLQARHRQRNGLRGAAGEQQQARSASGGCPTPACSPRDGDRSLTQP
jgi:hypothetical protein